MFKDKVVIITGASSGIGAGTAVAFAKEGAKLVLGGRNHERLKATGKACEEQGIKSDDVILVPGDLTKEDDCNNIVDQAAKNFGQIDILVNNAGNFRGGNIETATVEDVDYMFASHARAAFIISKRAVPLLKLTKGCIVNISSSFGNSPAPHVLPYGMAKAAMNHFSQSLAQDVGPIGVRVNCISPALVDTPALAKTHGPLDGHPEKKSEFFAMMGEIYPLRRIGKVEDVVNMILFLSSDAASFVTGTLVHVDGGITGKNTFC